MMKRGSISGNTGYSDSLTIGGDEMIAAQIVARDATIFKLVVQLDEATILKNDTLKNYDSMTAYAVDLENQLAAARQSRARLVQLVRSFGEIRKTLGNVGAVFRERDAAKESAKLWHDRYVAQIGEFTRIYRLQDEINEALKQELAQHRHYAAIFRKETDALGVNMEQLYALLEQLVTAMKERS